MTLSAGVTQRVTHERAWPLFGTTSTRQIEQLAQSTLAPNTLMQRAGMAVARLALAVAPHSQMIWIACGPGNNGGDGLEAATQLHRLGKRVHVTWLGSLSDCPPDTQQAYQRCIEAGLTINSQAPVIWDLAIDALLGLGATRAPASTLAHWLQAMHQSQAPVVQVDLPSGLSADTGVDWSQEALTTAPANRHTLALLTLKPGMFTADGRDACGQVWFNDLGISPSAPADAWLQSALPHAGQRSITNRRHNSHKGSYGDVAVIGGATGMTGAALLAGHAALRSGAGRVMVALLDQTTDSTAQHVIAPPFATSPTLMMRDAHDLDVRHCTVVCGCGGGGAVLSVFPRVLSTAPRLVIDADGLNALQDQSLWPLLLQRASRGFETVLTPHPLEAARLLQSSATNVQQDRCAAARQLAQNTRAVVVLKGSGTVIAIPGPSGKIDITINPTGHPRLASAGTGDVLAGMIGAYMAQGLSATEAACAAVAHHGQVAEMWPNDVAFDALTMSERL
jgi:hydroxyethylthiazole kinase-like uncharacterized protein yjeF